MTTLNSQEIADRYTATAANLLDNPTRERVAFFVSRAMQGLTEQPFGGFREQAVDSVEVLLSASIRALNDADHEAQLDWGRDHAAEPAMPDPRWLDDVWSPAMDEGSVAVRDYLRSIGFAEVRADVVKAIVKAAPPPLERVRMDDWIFKTSTAVRRSMGDSATLKNFGPDPGFLR